MSNSAGSVFTAVPLPDDAVELGRLQEAWGLKGWIHVLPHSAATEALFASSDWFLQPPEARFGRGFSAFSTPVAVQVAEIRAHAGAIVARLEGVDQRSAAEALKGARIYLSRRAFPVPPEGEYYWVDLLGLDVFNRQGVHLGVVQGLLASGPNSVLVLECHDASDASAAVTERMIPFVSAYVDSVDQASRRITVDWQPDY